MDRLVEPTHKIVRHFVDELQNGELRFLELKEVREAPRQYSFHFTAGRAFSPETMENSDQIGELLKNWEEAKLISRKKRDVKNGVFHQFQGNGILLVHNRRSMGPTLDKPYHLEVFVNKEAVRQENHLFELVQKYIEANGKLLMARTRGTSSAPGVHLK